MLTLYAVAPANAYHATPKNYVDAADNLKAPLASPLFTGNPRAPTPASGDNSVTIATTAFIKAQNYIASNQNITITGDVAGTGNINIPTTVQGLRGFPVTGTTPATNQLLAWNGSAWAPTPLSSITGFLPLTGGTLSGSLTINVAAPSLLLTNTTSNWIYFSNTGLNIPTYFAHSPGTKIILWDGVTSTTVDYAIGMTGSTLWFSVPAANTQFQWFGGTTVAATLSGAGALSIIGGLTVAGYIQGAGYQSRAGTAGAFQGNNFNFQWTGSAAILWVDNVSIGQIAVGSNLSNYLPLTGGTITGTLTVNNSITSTGSNANIAFNDRAGGSNWLWYSTGSIARLYNGADRFTVDSGGSIYCTGNALIGASMRIQGGGDWGGSNTFASFTNHYIRLMVNSGDDANSGSITYRVFDGGALGIIGCGASGSRWTHLWDHLKIDNFLQVLGNAEIDGGQCVIYNSNTVGFHVQQAGGSWVRMYDDGSPHIEISGGTLYINYNTGASTYFGGGINASDIYSRGNLNTSGSIGGTGAYLYLSGWGNGSVNGNGGPLVYGDGNYLIVKCGGNNYGFQARNYGGGNIFTADGNGNCFCPGNMQANGSLGVNGIWWGNNGGWWWTGSPIHTDSDIHCSNMYADGGNIFCSGLQVWNNGGWWWTNNPFYTNSVVQAGAYVQANSGGTALYAPNGDTVCQNVTAAGSSAGGAGSGVAVMCRNGAVESDRYGTAFYAPNGNVVCQQLVQSDIRIKRDIKDYSKGLQAVLTLRPVTYCYNGKGGTRDDGKEHVGLIADEVLSVMPEMVDMLGLGPMTDMKILNVNTLTYALVNAVREIEPRIATLEGIAYNELTAILWKANQELTDKLEAVTKRLTQLEQLTAGAN
jgi:hypothetical protein